MTAASKMITSMNFVGLGTFLGGYYLGGSQVGLLVTLFVVWFMLNYVVVKYVKDTTEPGLEDTSLSSDKPL